MIKCFRFKLVVKIVLIVTLLAGCISRIQENNYEDTEQIEVRSSHSIENTVLYDELGLSKYDPAIDVSFVREFGADIENLLSFLPGETLEDNRWTRLYEQTLGIRIHYDWTEEGDFYRQKLNFAIASGQIPDIIKVSAEQLRILNNAGLIQDLTSVYEQYATTLTKAFVNQEGSGPIDAATIDGKLMAIPEIASSIEGAMYIWLRTDWLEYLGLEPPKTIDDVLTISKAFTYLDPDQNGEDDTFGLAITNYLWDPVLGIKGFMAGFNAFPEIWLVNDNGELVFGGIQPEVKTALQTLQDMYRSGQLDPEFSFKNGLKVEEYVKNSKIGMLYGEQWASFLVQTSHQTDRDAAWQAYPIVSVSGEPAKVPLKFSTTNYFAVRKDFEHPEAVVKLFNLHLEKNWGKTENFETYYSSPYPVWKLSPVTPFPAKKNYFAYLQIEEASRTGDWSKLNSEARSIKKLIDIYFAGGEDSSTGWGWERTYGKEGAFSILHQYVKNDQLLYESYTGGPTDTMIEAQSILHDLQHETYINIILGDPIDEFDKFVEKWRKLGGDDITKEVNEWYRQNRQFTSIN